MTLKTTFLRSISRQLKYIGITTVAVRRTYDKYDRRQRFGGYGKIGGALFGSVLLGSLGTDSKKNKDKLSPTIDADAVFEAGARRPDLPTYSAEEVSKHGDNFWVTYRQGVYDVTSFLPSHPGGEQIYNAAGLSVEPFWNVYGMHKTKEVYTLLESYRIGNLHPDDIIDHSDDELWAREPYRDPRLRVHTPRPFNAEVRPADQVDHFDTPNELFYVRQHMPVPDIDPSTHRLTVTVLGERGDVIRQCSFTMEELDTQFEQHTVRAALMCAGNRRSEMAKIKSAKGISWSTGAISNAVWRGPRLAEVLARCGVTEGEGDLRHVILSGADIDATGVNFSTSLPIHAALGPGVILARSMNGTSLPPDHGKPVRALVPGAPAVRSVKWLESITVSKNESDSHWHQKDYRSFNASTTWETADFSRAPPLYSLPVTSAVCVPGDGDTVCVSGGRVEIKGYAYSGGGAKIVRVDVCGAPPGCGAREWTEAALLTDGAPPPHHYSWALWTVSLPVAKGQKELEIWVKATDSNFNTQPEKFDDIWNIRGLLSNAYHKIKVQLKHS